MRKYYIFMSDLFWLAISPVVALFVRDNLTLSFERVDMILPYLALTATVGLFTFLVAGVHKGLWRYASLPDLMRIVTAVTVTILLSLFLTFAFNRLEGIARGIPVIQWFVLIGALCGTRVIFRHLSGRRRKRASVCSSPQAGPEHVLIIGLNPVTELYLRSVAEYASGRIAVAGILAAGKDVQGRLVQFHKIVGNPKQLRKILAQYEIHGLIIQRIVITAPFPELSLRAQAELAAVEQSGTVEIDFFAERLGLIAPHDNGGPDSHRSAARAKKAARFATGDQALHRANGYIALKRALDALGAAILLAGLAPLMAVVALLVAIDAGLPVIFWQLRPQRYGRPFKLYKFRTMGPAHDVEGNLIPDEKRSSAAGRFLRRTRLDELPQLYNILIGEMSFVGPRPLLAAEQREWDASRLQVRPGLTGWAQVNGGRDISIEEKIALDLWYVSRMSLWLDATILLRTIGMVLRGERPNPAAVQIALEDLSLPAQTATVAEQPAPPAAPPAAPPVSLTGAKRKAA